MLLLSFIYFGMKRAMARITIDNRYITKYLNNNATGIPTMTFSNPEN